MDVLSGKWKTVILAYLHERPMRYSELRSLLPKLSDKVLTDRLRDVLNAGLVVRRKSTTTAGADLYVLSERGDSLRTIRRWSDSGRTPRCDRLIAYRRVVEEV